ncbi:MAG: MBL fold metallo-hydrolase [Candidatus Omnitrophota bacterium]
MILFQPFFHKEANEANTYIVGCERTGEAILVDAGSDSPQYDAFLQQKNARLTGIFLTHHHWDHDGALASIFQRHDVPVYSFTGSTPKGKAVQEGAKIPIGRLNARVLQTTGHTPNSISLVVENVLVFVGDALFAGSIGGTSNEAAKREEIENIRTKIFILPDETLLCPGHGPLTTVGIEKNANPFFG